MKKRIPKSLMLIFLGLFILIGLIYYATAYGKMLPILGEPDIGSIFGVNLETDVPARLMTKLITGILGTIMTGFGIFGIGIIRNAWDSRKKWVWNTLLLGSLAWYLPDTALSLFHGVFFNAIGNTLLYALFFIPLLISKSQFTEKE